MSDFIAKSLAVLGRQPNIGMAELESLDGSQNIKPFGQSVLIDLDTDQIKFSRLGGTIKLAKVLAYLPSATWIDVQEYLAKNIPAHLVHVGTGKFTLGLSLYGYDVKPKNINRSLLEL